MCVLDKILTMNQTYHWTLFALSPGSSQLFNGGKATLYFIIELKAVKFHIQNYTVASWVADNKHSVVATQLTEKYKSKSFCRLACSLGLRRTLQCGRMEVCKVQWSQTSALAQCKHCLSEP